MSDNEQTNAPEGQDQQTFDLFDDPSAVANKAEEHEREARNNKGESRSQTEQREKDEPKFAAGTPLHYSGHELRLPEGGMDAEAIFAWLADDFPELSSDRADVREDKTTGRLVIDLRSFEKGAISPEVLAQHPGLANGEEHPPPVRRVEAPEGFYEIRATSIGTFVAAATEERIAKLDGAAPGIPRVGRELRQGFYPALPRPPAGLLARIVAIFAEVPEKEAVVYVICDRRQGRHFLIWTDQRDANSGSVTYDPIPETDRFAPYVEIRSNNTMPAFWSATDDAPEERTLLHGVIGRVDREPPEAAFRLSCGGIFLPLRASDIFSAHPASTAGPHPGRLVEDVSYEWRERLAKAGKP